MDLSVPINEKSIVGFSALTKSEVIVDDAYRIPENLPYHFNKDFDRKSGYVTSSMLTLPLKGMNDKLVGVMQLINARNEQNRTVPFSRESRTYVPLFAINATLAIERGIMTRELILRMMKMAEMRDPSETGTHVQRVGAYSAEIYQRWALNRKTAKKEVKRTKDLIRITAMLHDVGKVGIADAILKKPGKLDDQEFAEMKWHTIRGAQLFMNRSSEMDEMSFEIALNHHEKWAGGGYPGKVPDIMSDVAKMGVPKTGDEIPLAARIASLADVYDALSCRRCYKEPWTEERVVAEIEKDSGRSFDPELVEAFFQIYDVVKAIREKSWE